MSCPDDYPIRKILIANRGEIACRVIRSARAMGLATVAVHHGVERRARHVREADAAVELRGDTPVAAHLDAAQIIEAARASGRRAIHPGYGFLSENAAFARAVTDAGLVFIGPAPETIELMGDKISSRDFAASHGVPVAPSVMPTEDVDAFAKAAAEIGFPRDQGLGRWRRQGHASCAAPASCARPHDWRRARRNAISATVASMPRPMWISPDTSRCR
ncbi:MAG: biotin carboxylase N-terminal domain-containing protein [Burkholderiaceae bacterium]